MQMKKDFVYERGAQMQIYFADTRGLAGVDKACIADKITPLVKRERLCLYERHHNITKLTAGAVLYLALKHNGVDYLTEKTEFTELGKEYFVNADICFNISHSKDIACCAVDKCDVGIDCEQINPKTDHLRLAERFFSREEIAYISDSKNGVDDFFRIWTMKESYVKYTSQGFSKPVSSFTCIPTDGVCVLEDAYIKTYRINGAYLSVCSKHNDFPEKVTDITDFFLQTC